MIKSGEQLFNSIIDKFSHTMASPATVREGLNKLRSLINKSPNSLLITNIFPLFELLQKKTGAISKQIFSFLGETAELSDNPDLIVRAMINARDKSHLLPALELATTLAHKGNLKVTHSFIEFLGDCFVERRPYFTSTLIALQIIDIIKYYQPKKETTSEKEILAMYLYDTNLKIRLLAAWLLDNSTKSINQDTARSILGKRMYRFFKPFLSYTRATYTNLLNLQIEEGAIITLHKDIKRALGILGDKLLLEVIAKLGWNRFNIGLRVESIREILVDGAPPYMIPETVAPLTLKYKGAKFGRKLYKVVGCGSDASNISSSKDVTEKIDRFRNYNLNHAVLLNNFLDTSPLTTAKTRDIISRMDQIVEDYVVLFNSYSDECSILPEVYSTIKSLIVAELDNHNKVQPLSADLMRRVLFFEEPHSLGEVTTLHGLKRYLHQNGLSMGSKLAEGGHSPNRTIDLLLLSEEGILFSYDKIQFSDFDSGAENNLYGKNIPYSVGLLIDSFSHLILYGQEQFPKVDIFCYGNEVHYYFGFRNHPAFLRIDYAPPLQGGMIDLEYFGVSNYNLNEHPNVKLDAIQLFFSSMDFNIQLDGTRIHARYDKERALTLGDLCEKAKLIFNLAPYFMDLDWIIGSLAIGSEAHKKVSAAWSEFFINWGFIPINSVLSKDRLGIISGFIDEPTMRREIIWNGKGDYKDIYSGDVAKTFYKEFLITLNEGGLTIGIPENDDNASSPGQINIQEWLLNPIKQSIARGELISSSNNQLEKQSSSLFMRVSEIELFAMLLSPNSVELITAIGIANTVQQLERILSFSTTGSINGFIVETSTIVLRGESIKFYVLRGSDNMIRLAFYTHSQVLYKARKNHTSKWIYNAEFDIKSLLNLLRVNNFVDAAINPVATNSDQEYGILLKSISQSSMPSDKMPLRDERIIKGLKASPGVSVGKVIFGTKGHDPQDFKGSILLTNSLKPEDTSSLYYTAGIISTGGGILSHAGLIAMQLQKPAMIISGKWLKNSDETPTFCFSTDQYELKNQIINGFNVTIRTNIYKKEYSLNEGDLVIINAFTGIVRVLGHGRNVLALHDSFKTYKHVNSMLTQAETANEILMLRGKRLRALHQIKNILNYSDEPLTCRYTIFEILLNSDLNSDGITIHDKGFILSMLLNNKNLVDDTRDYLDQIMKELLSRLNDSLQVGKKYIPTSDSLYEIISARLNIKHLIQSIDGTKIALQTSKIKLPPLEDKKYEEIQLLTTNRLSVLQQNLIKRIKQISSSKLKDPILRHLIRQIERLNKIYEKDEKSAVLIRDIQEDLLEHDHSNICLYEKDVIIDKANCGFELSKQIGWKAVNLAEIDRLIKDEFVPPWFAITDYAFRETLKIKIDENSQSKQHKVTLLDAIKNVLANEEINDEQKSQQIQGLWDKVILPKKLIAPIVKAYKKITQDNEISKGNTPSQSYVAVRSSSLEEDSEADAHAGEFETFLFIKGEEELLWYIKRNWSGLWTERAIYNRSLKQNGTSHIGGGVIVQRMVNSRVSGVLQTINIPRGNNREMVINAGLGLGEGIVSGIVAADQITVSKNFDMENDILHFNYITSDKTDRIVFNNRSKSGTIRMQTLFHQRLRPALEYFELCELVKVAASLEKSYGYPLDIEFGIEESKLWILQVRPVTAFQSVLNETIADTQLIP